jgi:hypothetical protein
MSRIGGRVFDELTAIIDLAWAMVERDLGASSALRLWLSKDAVF